MYFYFYSSTFFEKILLLYLSTFFRDTFKNTRVFSKVFFLPCFEGSKGSKPRFPRSQRFKDSKGTKGFQGSQDLLKKYSGVPNNSAGTIINFGNFFLPARLIWHLHDYWIFRFGETRFSKWQKLSKYFEIFRYLFKICNFDDIKSQCYSRRYK